MKSQPIKTVTFVCLQINIGLVFFCAHYAVTVFLWYLNIVSLKNNQNVGNIFQEKPARHVVYCNKFINLVQSAYITLG